MAYNNNYQNGGVKSSTLQNVFNKSFPGSNLFQISLVKDTNPELPFYKNKYFFFISMVPGMKTQEGGRTFDVNNKIQLKVEVEKLLALSKSIHMIASRMVEEGRFSIIADSSRSQHSQGQGMYKTVFASEYNATGNNPQRLISIGFKAGRDKPVGCVFTPSEAFAIAQFIEWICKKCVDFEFDDRQVSVGTVKSAPRANSSYNAGPVPANNQPQPQNVSVDDVVNNFENAMSNASGGGGQAPNQGSETPNPFPM
jgi:hypothetical protein